MALVQLGQNSTEGSVAPGLHMQVNASTGATQVLTAAQSGSVMLLDRATLTYTLPAPVVGLNYKFFSTILSTAQAVNTDAATTFLLGSVQQTVGEAATGEGQVANGTSHIGLSMNGTTTGGIIGTSFDVTCVTSTIWIIRGLLISSGTMVTMFTT